MSMQSNEELKHYGVLGMKWGVRKAVLNYANYSQERAKFLKKSITNPRLTAKANAQSISNDTRKNQIRRTILGSYTLNDMKDINKRVDSLIKEKMNKKLSEI